MTEAVPLSVPALLPLVVLPHGGPAAFDTPEDLARVRRILEAGNRRA